MIDDQNEIKELKKIIAELSEYKNWVLAREQAEFKEKCRRLEHMIFQCKIAISGFEEFGSKE